MKKMNNKGFMLAETLIVSTFLIVTLMFLYVQFTNISKSYDASFRYNTVDGLYGVKNISKFIVKEDLGKLSNDIIDLNYIDISTCPTAYITEVTYCQKLLDTLNVKTVLFTKENLTDFKNSTLSFDEELNEFIRYVSFDKVAGYRLIVQYHDNTFASLKVVA